MVRISAPTLPGFFLGGELAPIGLCVGFLDRSLRDVLTAAAAWRSELGTPCEQREVGQLPGAASALPPLEAPWTRELYVDCGAWTAYLNNGIDGGDPSAAAPAIAQRLDCRLVTAIHAPLHRPGHGSTQLVLVGPEGKKPLRCVRTLAAHAEDGRWRWYESGAVQAWEQPERYLARKVRDRFDRPLLVGYLRAMGIQVDAPAFFGAAVALQRKVTWATRKESLEEVRLRFGWT